MGGFSHSSFVTLPFSVTGLLASNSAAKEWCPDRGCAAATTSKAPIIKCCVFMFEPDFLLAAARFSLLYNEAFRVRKIFGIRRRAGSCCLTTAQLKKPARFSSRFRRFVAELSWQDRDV